MFIDLVHDLLEVVLIVDVELDPVRSLLVGVEDDPQGLQHCLNDVLLHFTNRALFVADLQNRNDFSPVFDRPQH